MSSRSKALSVFRSLHRARKQVFANDDNALAAAREKINEEFRKNMFEADGAKINELITTAEDADKLLRQTIVQAQEVEEGVYELRITKDTILEKNNPFVANAELPRRGKFKKCSDEPN